MSPKNKVHDVRCGAVWCGRKGKITEGYLCLTVFFLSLFFLEPKEILTNPSTCLQGKYTTHGD